MKYGGFVGPTYKLDALTFDCQRSVNLFPITSEVGTSKSPNALVSTPGYEQFTEVDGGPIRGAKTASSTGRAFAVSGFGLYEINTDGTGTLINSLLTAVARVSMAENGTQLMIVDGTYGYIYNMDTGVFAQITDTDFPANPLNVTYQDGYFIVAIGGTPNFAISNLYDGLVWDALDQTNVIANPDNLLKVLSDNGMLWCFGDISTEVFQNTGAASFPFERVPGAIVQTGIAGGETALSLDNSIFWLGKDDLGRGVVWRSSGLSATRVSTQAIESIIATSPDFAGSSAYVYHERGHAFYCLNVQGVNTTLCYDVSTGAWHERVFWDTVTNSEQQHRASCHFFFDQKNMIGDRVNGKIYRQSLDIYDFDGEEIHRIRVSPHVSNEKQNLAYSCLELDMETGVGLTSGQGSDPQMMLRYSDDGGRTWSNEKWTSVGAIGKYKTRVRWQRLGSSRDRVFSVRYTEPTKCQINEAYINNA